MMRKVAISDIHGCLASFNALLEKIDFQMEDELYILGDCIDRGPDSKGVLDKIMMLRQDGYSVFCLRGNHEQMMLDSRDDLRERKLWKINGGPATLASFGAADVNMIPNAYFEMIENMPHYLEVDNYLLVHAGFDFSSSPLENQDAMLWIRRWYPDLDRYWLGDRIILHGHTPVAKSIIEQQFAQLEQLPILDIDNGCFITSDPERGGLCAFEMTKQELFFQKNVD